MAYAIGVIILAVWSLVAFAAGLTVMPAEWPKSLRVIFSLALGAGIPGLLSLWLWALLRGHQTMVRRGLPVGTLVALQTGLLVLAVAGFDQSAHQLMRAVVSLWRYVPPPLEAVASRDAQIPPTTRPLSDEGAPARSRRLGLEPTHRWSIRLGSEGPDQTMGLVVGPGGRAVVASKHRAQADPHGTRRYGGDQVFVTNISAQGLVQWQRRFSGGDIGVMAITDDRAGNLFVLGAGRGDLDFGAGPVTTYLPHVYLVKLDPAGNLVWSQLLDAKSDDARRLTLLPDGHIVVTGTFSHSVKTGTLDLNAVGAHNLFVLLFNQDGEPVWAKRFGESRGAVWPEHVGIDGNDIVIVGQYHGARTDELESELQAKLDAQRSTPANAGLVQERGVFLLRLKPNGEAASMQRLQFGHDKGVGLAATLDREGNIIVARGFWGEIRGEAYVYRSADALDLFVGKFDRHGKHLWSRRFGGTHDQGFPVLATDKTGRVFVAGTVVTAIHLGLGTLQASGMADTFMAAFAADGTPQGACLFRNDYIGGAGGLGIDSTGRVFLAGTFANTTNVGGGDLTAIDCNTGPRVDSFVAKFSW